MNLNAQKPSNIIEDIISNSKKYWGMTIGQIEKELCLSGNKGSKNYAASVIKHALNFKKGHDYIENLDDVGIHIKTVRCNPGLRPIYAMSLRGYKYEDIINETWNDSKLKTDVENILIAVLTLPKKGTLQEDAILETVLFHMPDDEDMGMMEEDWENIVEIIKEGSADELTGRMGKIIQTRPKAKNSQDRISAPGGHMLVKKGFFIRREYLQKILNQYVDEILNGVS